MSVYGDFSGRYIAGSLDRYPLWDASEWEDEAPTPNYYGQTRALAESLGGTLVDLAGGFVGVAVAGPVDSRGRSWAMCALDDECQTLGSWVEDAQGETVGDVTTVPFTPFPLAGE